MASSSGTCNRCIINVLLPFVIANLQQCCCCLRCTINSYIHLWTVCKPNHTSPSLLRLRLTRQLTNTHCMFNCPSWISGRARMTVENISLTNSTKEWCRAEVANYQSDKPPNKLLGSAGTIHLNCSFKLKLSWCVYKWKKKETVAHRLRNSLTVIPFATKLQVVIRKCIYLTDFPSFCKWRLPCVTSGHWSEHSVPLKRFQHRKEIICLIGINCFLLDKTPVAKGSKRFWDVTSLASVSIPFKVCILLFWCM